MKFVDEFRNIEAARELAAGIGRAVDSLPDARRLRFMEVCGGHTMAIHRFGIPHLLPDVVELLSGPGCPVCVTPTTYLDRALELGRRDGAVLATFGDLYRVPGSQSSLEDAVADGLDVRVVYSATDAVQIALEAPEREVIFLAIGFETTAPGTAATIRQARAEGAGNFRVLSGHKTMPPALKALVDSPSVALDGLILPGHVSTIIGTEPYEFLARDYGIACCVTGFEPTDVLLGILSLVRQLVEGKPRVDNQYRRAARDAGNPLARDAVAEVFEPADSQWRGLGMIPASGLAVRAEWQEHSVDPPDPDVPSQEHEVCRCTEVLRGLVRPVECPLFGKACTPDSPVGACMVSSEGACAASYKYGEARRGHD